MSIESAPLSAEDVVNFVFKFPGSRIASEIDEPLLVGITRDDGVERFVAFDGLLTPDVTLILGDQ